MEATVSGILRKTYSITSWKDWDHEINSFVADFRERFSIAPNMLLANRATFTHIDMIANKKNMSDCNGNRPEDCEYTDLGSFAGPDYSLDFAYDEKVPDSRVSLIYDSDPGGDGEPVPEDDTEDVIGNLKIA